LRESAGRSFQKLYSFDFRFAFFAVRTLDFFAGLGDFLAADFVAPFFVVFVAAFFGDAFFVDFFADFSAVFLVIFLAVFFGAFLEVDFLRRGSTANGVITGSVTRLSAANGTVKLASSSDVRPEMLNCVSAIAMATCLTAAIVLSIENLFSSLSSSKARPPMFTSETTFTKVD
jgi:hypothetical protein